LARLWRCAQSDCPGYVYNPLVGEWTQDIPARTAFEDLPADFFCPACGAEREAFRLERDLAA
jgi:rubredoxin